MCLLMSQNIGGVPFLARVLINSDMSSEESAHSKKIGRACEGSKQELLKCLKESDCVKVYR